MTTLEDLPVREPATEIQPSGAAADRDRGRWRSIAGATWPPVAVGTLLAALAGAFAAAPLPLGTALGLLAALGALTVAGAGVWRLLLPAAGGLQSAVFGCPLGLALAGIGVVLSGASGVFAVRWATVLVALLAWVPVLRRGRRRAPEASGPGIGWGLWGAVLAQGALLVPLRAHLSTFPADVSGWRANYVDIPWHIAFTAEALERSPEVYPWVPDVTLGYTWLFSAALGGWGSTTDVTAADLVVRIAPALFSAVVPVVVALAAWTVSRSRLAALLAPLLLLVAQGPLFIFRDTMDITPVWLIPNRDFSHLLVVMAVAALALSAGQRSTHRWSVARSALLLLVLSFCASASKGSALPALLGAAGILIPHALLVRRPVVPHLVRLAAVVLGMLTAQYGVTRSLSYLRVDPLTFLGGQTPPGLGPALTALAVVVLLGSILFIVVTVLPDGRLAERALPLAGGGLGGVAALVLFGHPGLSQLYFLHAAWPLLCTGVAVGLAHWTRVLGPAFLLAFAGAGASVAMILAPPADGAARQWALTTAALLVAVAAVLLAPALVRLARGGRGTQRPVLLLSAAVLCSCFAVQNWGPPSIALPASWPSADGDLAAVDGPTREAYAVLAAASSPDDLVMTNKHCQVGHVATGDCDPRWFGVSAFAERRVLVEGWSYTRLSAGVAVEDVYWQPELLARNDAFLAAPDAASCRFFVGRGVEWVLVDKREPWSDRLAEFAEPVLDRPTVAVYRLVPDCTGG